MADCGCNNFPASLGNVTFGALVGIQEMAPQAPLHITALVGGDGDARRGIIVVDTTDVAQGVGGGISFGGKYTTGGGLVWDFAHIKGIKENGNNNDYAGALVFCTRVNTGPPTERARITSGGNVGIGTPSPNLSGFQGRVVTIKGSPFGTLEVVGDYSAGDGNVALVVFRHAGGAGGTIAIITADRKGANNTGELVFFTANAGAVAERMRITAGGNVGIAVPNPAST